MFKKILVLALVLTALTVSGCFALDTTPFSVSPNAPISPASWTNALAPADPVYTVDYDNTKNIFVDDQGYASYMSSGANYLIGDDVHRTTSQDLIGITFEYYSLAQEGSLFGAMYIISNPSNDDPYSEGCELLGAYDLGQLPVGYKRLTVNLGNPLAAPADLWIAFVFNDDNTGILVYDPPTTGTSHDLLLMEDDYGIYTFGFGGNPNANLCIATHSVPDVPEPGSMVALGSGLVGLVGFAIRRRR